jgi:uncharacterized protein YndB with AHSA1/START domain
VTEVRGRYELAHPVDLVWRALTEPPLIARWFVEAELRPRVGSAFRLRAPGVPGLDAATLAEVKEVAAPHRLVMRWQSEQLHTVVTWALTPAGDRTRLDVTQVGFLGVRGSERQSALRETYDVVFGERLPAVLDDLAGGPPAALPPLVIEPPRASRSRAAVLAGAAAALLALLGIGVWSVLPERSPVPAADREGLPPAVDPAAPAGGIAVPPSALAPGASGASGAPARSGPPGSSAPSGAAGPAGPSAVGEVPAVPRVTAVPTEAGPAVLRAAYRAAGSDLLGYRGEVTVTNTGGRSAPWSVTVTLPPLARVDRVEGASHTQTGTDVVLTGGKPLAAGGASAVTFHVVLDLPLLDPQRPVACRIGSTPCSGL